MLPRFLVGVCFVALAGCGGSSSETPPPLEPDYAHGEGRSITPAPKSSAARPAPEGDVSEPEGEQAPPPSTWGDESTD
jgi:hypothetical protein